MNGMRRYNKHVMKERYLDHEDYEMKRMNEGYGKKRRYNKHVMKWIYLEHEEWRMRREMNEVYGRYAMRGT